MTVYILSIEKDSHADRYVYQTAALARAGARADVQCIVMNAALHGTTIKPARLFWHVENEDLQTSYALGSRYVIERAPCFDMPRRK